MEPYLKVHCQDGYIPGAEDIYHEKNGIIGKIHVKRYLADDPKGVVVISHGFTEGAPKYEEMIYYFYRLAITYTCQNIWDTAKATA